VSQQLKFITQFIGRTISSIRTVARNVMRNIVTRGVANNVQQNVSITTLKDEAQILERTNQKFDFTTGASLLSDLNPDADIDLSKYSISSTNPRGSNYNMNASEFRDMVGRSDGASNQSMSGFVGAKNSFSEGENIPLPVKSGGTFTLFNMTPPLRDITEKSLTTGYANPATTAKAQAYYNDEYIGSGTVSETVGFDFKFVNESGGLRCFIRQNNGPSTSNLANRNVILHFGGGTPPVHDYKFTKDRYSYVSDYTESSQFSSNERKVNTTSGTYLPFYFLPHLTNGVDTLRLKSLTNVSTKQYQSFSHNSGIVRGEQVSTRQTTSHAPSAVTIPTPSSSNNASGVTFIGMDTQQTGMGVGDSFGFTQKMTASTNGKKGINHRRVFRMQLQASKSNVSRGQERTILNFFFALETQLSIYDVGAPLSTFAFTLDFSGIDITGGDAFGWANSYGFAISGGYGGYSDSRLKDNIRFVHRPHGHNVYTWDWNELAKSIGADKQPNYGVLADELVSTNPEALEKDENGYWKVNYFKLRQNKKE
jgi:hypothetical protein